MTQRIKYHGTEPLKKTNGLKQHTCLIQRKQYDTIRMYTYIYGERNHLRISNRGGTKDFCPFFFPYKSETDDRNKDYF